MTTAGGTDVFFVPELHAGAVVKMTHIVSAHRADSKRIDGLNMAWYLPKRKPALFIIISSGNG
jgi:hypothetical protein